MGGSSLIPLLLMLKGISRWVLLLVALGSAFGPDASTVGVRMAAAAGPGALQDPLVGIGEEWCADRPYLSIVVVGRNDEYGGQPFVKRMQLWLDVVK